MEPTVLEQLRICIRAKKLQPAEIIGALSENYHGYAQVRASGCRCGAAGPISWWQRCCAVSPVCTGAQMANLMRDWHCFLGDEPKDIDREIR